MDCACLPLFYMDRELVWRSVILFCQSPLLFLEGRISPVFSLYFSSASRMSRLDDPGSWWKWISFSLCFSLETVVKKDVNLFLSIFLCEIFPAPNLFMPFSVFLFFLTQSAFFFIILLLPNSLTSLIFADLQIHHRVSVCTLITLVNILRSGPFVRVCFCVSMPEEGLNMRWVDLESWQVHYCSGFSLAWHVCAHNLAVMWKSCADVWPGSLLSVGTHKHTLCPLRPRTHTLDPLRTHQQYSLLALSHLQYLRLQKTICTKMWLYTSLLHNNTNPTEPETETLLYFADFHLTSRIFTSGQEWS